MPKMTEDDKLAADLWWENYLEERRNSRLRPAVLRADAMKHRAKADRLDARAAALEARALKRSAGLK